MARSDAQVEGESRWLATLALLAALALYVVLPARLIIGPRWLVPALELALLIPLTLFKAQRVSTEERYVRSFSIALIALINVANIVSVALLVQHLLSGGKVIHGRNLVYSAFAVWFTNIIVFGLWFWELDRGGPGARAGGEEGPPDFQFPQMVSPEMAPKAWRPAFFDYLYVSITNAAAFSPTDTMPLSQAAKGLMTVESLVSIVTVVVVAARAVNILQ